jgi:hypothetical protein
LYLDILFSTGQELLKGKMDTGKKRAVIGEFRSCSQPVWPGSMTKFYLILLAQSITRILATEATIGLNIRQKNFWNQGQRRRYKICVVIQRTRSA